MSDFKAKMHYIQFRLSFKGERVRNGRRGERRGGEWNGVV